MESYLRLERVFRRASNLKAVVGLLDWDRYVNLPHGSSAARGAQVGELVDILAETFSDPRLADWADAANQADLDDWQRANLREMRRELAFNAATPVNLTIRLAQAAADCETAWRDAKATSNFQAIQPSLEIVFELAQALATTRGEGLGLRPFDAMMEAWEPGARCGDLDGHFDCLAVILPSMAAEAAERAEPILPEPDPSLSAESQMRAARALAAHLGLEPENSRLDACAQAFFMDDNPDDTRIGIRPNSGALRQVLMGLIHEVGHARHERNSPRAWRGQPVGRPRSAAIQESQALLLEMVVGRSDAFWRGAAPVLTTALGQADRCDWRRMGALSRRVQLGAVRVEADELSYGLHVILRYRLERDLIEGRLAVSDLPEAWNEGFKELFGFTPANAAEGCLQDIHWHRALFGYFPSYAQGQWAAAQFVEAAERDIPDLWQGDGRFDDLADWLRRQVHEQASRLPTHEMIIAATGKSLTPDAFLAHATRRYLGRDKR